MFKTVSTTYLFSFPIEFESFFQRSCEAVPRNQNLQIKVDVYSVKPTAEIRKIYKATRKDPTTLYTVRNTGGHSNKCK